MGKIEFLYGVSFKLSEAIKKVSSFFFPWKKEFKTFMQPHSEVLVILISKGKIKYIFDIISLKNKGYSWLLAEGLWYYNTLHPCLTPEQIKIIQSYNGMKDMINFRTIGELKSIYKFN